MSGIKSVAVGPFSVADATTADLLAAVRAAVGTKYVAMAVHVGGLNNRRDESFVRYLHEADIVYADGASVVALAKVAGARRMERAATTDIGLPMIRVVADALQRPARVAIVGGEPGVASSAGREIESQAPARVVFATHGFHADYVAILQTLRELEPDVLVVGMGMPREARWVSDHLDELPPTLVMTCGGWLGFLAGNERRAPKWMQQLGLEWFYRLSQSPTRLLARYLSGMVGVASLLPAQFRLRRQLND